MDYGMGQYTNTDLKKFILSALSSMKNLGALTLTNKILRKSGTQKSMKSDRAAGMRGIVYASSTL